MVFTDSSRLEVVESIALNCQRCCKHSHVHDNSFFVFAYTGLNVRARRRRNVTDRNSDVYMAIEFMSGVVGYLVSGILSRLGGVVLDER